MNQIIGEIGIENLINEGQQEIKYNGTLNTRFFYFKFFAIILIIKLCATVFAYFIYSKFTPFVDVSYYLSTCRDYCFGGWSYRTSITHLLFYSLKKIFVTDLIVNLFVSFSLSYVLWHVFKRNYFFLNKYLFFSALILPHFLIWSGMVGKDAIIIAGYLLIVRSCVNLTVRRTTEIFPLIIGMILPLIIRPQYLLAYGYLLFITLFFINFNYKFLQKPKHSFILLFLSLLFVFIALLFFWNNISIYLIKLMSIIKDNYFFSQTTARANRFNVIWEKPTDIITNLWWGLPIGIIGPTLHEVFVRPIMLPAFLEGLFSLALFVYLIITTIHAALINPKYNAFIILGFIPAILIGLMLNYPMGIFNPGAAIRYKQSLAPLFYFYPLLLMSEIKMKEALNR